MSEQDDFLKDLKMDGEEQKDDLLNQPLTPPEARASDADDPEVQPESVKDRRHRRLESRLQAEREANIALTERLKVLSEVERFRGETTDPDDVVSRIYGTNTPEGAEATRLLQQALAEREERAVERALEMIRRERAEEEGSVAEEESTLDSYLEEIEDSFGVDLSSRTADADRRGFFTLLERLSPKDRDGNIIEYADPIATWEEYQERKSRQTSSRAKDLSSRGMVRSGSSSDSKLQDSVAERYLKDAGII